MISVMSNMWKSYEANTRASKIILCRYMSIVGSCVHHDVCALLVRGNKSVIHPQIVHCNMHTCILSSRLEFPSATYLFFFVNFAVHFLKNYLFYIFFFFALFIQKQNLSLSFACLALPSCLNGLLCNINNE